MSGHLTLEHNTTISSAKSVEQICQAHQAQPAPKFGGELEIMFLRQDEKTKASAPYHILIRSKA